MLRKSIFITMVVLFSGGAIAANLEIDIKHEIDLKDGTYIAKEYGGQGRYTLITHDHGLFEGGDIAHAECTSGSLVEKLPPKYNKIKSILKSSDFILLKCKESA